jgi:hypothetical protein
VQFVVHGQDIKQHSFVGIAFHGVNDSTFDVVYLQPFQFRERAETLRSHGIQYVSLPLADTSGGDFANLTITQVNCRSIKITPGTLKHPAHYQLSVPQQESMRNSNRTNLCLVLVVLRVRFAAQDRVPD